MIDGRMRLASTFRSWAGSSFDNSMKANIAGIERLLGDVPSDSCLLDLGCDDGANTIRFAAAARARETHGVELVEERAELARERGVTVTVSNLADPLPYEDERFDAVVSNQVIEHLADTDRFVSEIKRVLKPEGLAVTSTENLASWHNIAALGLGWQPFSLTNVSSLRPGVGNPLAIHRGEDAVRPTSQHVRVFAYRGLREIFEAHSLVVKTIVGAGYYPLPQRMGRLDKRHAAFLTVAAVRAD